MQLKTLFAKSIIWKSAYFFSVLLLNLGIARYFNSAGSASIYFFSTVYAFIVMFAGISLESGMGYYAASDKDSVPRFFNLGIVWTLIIALITLLVTILFAHEFTGAGFSEAQVIFSAFCFISGNMLIAYCSALFYAAGNFRTPNLVGLTCNVLALVILFFTGSSFTLENYLYCYFFLVLVQGLTLGLISAGSRKSAWSLQFPGRKSLRDLLRYSLTAYLANILFMLVYRVDYWFVEKFCSREELGNYIQVSKLSQMLILIPSFLATAVFPVVASGRKKEVFARLGFLSRIGLIVIGFPCLVIGAFGSYLFPVLFGASFQQMSLPFILLIPGVLSLSSLYPLSAYYSGSNMVGINLRGSLLALLFIVVADLIMVPRAGIAAAAMVSSIGYILFQAYVLIIFKKQYRVNLGEFFFVRRSDFLWIKHSAYKLLTR